MRLSAVSLLADVYLRQGYVFGEAANARSAGFGPMMDELSCLHVFSELSPSLPAIEAGRSDTSHSQVDVFRRKLHAQLAERGRSPGIEPAADD